MVNKRSYERGFGGYMRIKRSISYRDNGTIRCEWWHKEGDEYYYNKEDGPAYTWYYDTGEKKHEEWWVADKLHKLDGPACINYNKDGTIDKEWYCINGEELSKEQWEDYIIKEAMKEALE